MRMRWGGQRNSNLGHSRVMKAVSGAEIQRGARVGARLRACQPVAVR